MKVKMDKENATAVLVMPKKVMREDSAVLSEQISDIMKEDVRTLVFDMEKTVMLDSATLGVLIYLRKNYSSGKYNCESAWEMQIIGQSLQPKRSRYSS